MMRIRTMTDNEKRIEDEKLNKVTGGITEEEYYAQAK